MADLRGDPRPVTRDSDGTDRPAQPALFPEPAKQKAAKRKQPETEIPDDWEPDDAAIATGRGLGFGVARVMSEGEKFAARNRAKRTTYVRWGQAFNLWLRNAKDYDAKNGGFRAPIRQSGSEELTAKIEQNRILLEEP